VRAEAELALAEPGLTAGARAALEEVLRGAERMETVIATLLGVARREGAHAVGAADAGEAAATAIDGVRSAAEHAGVSVLLSPPDEPLRAGADGDVVAQTLQPLLDNAVRHARSAVRVSVARANGSIAFVVQDDGDGIEGTDGARLFEPGLSTEGGAGLGLPLARRLARACGGDVVAVPDVEGGRFELRLPAVG
jgi:signal transduction histidine kinase